MSEFGQAVQHERMRLMGLIAEAREKIAELQGQISADEQRIEALEAYEQVKVGKASAGKGAKKGLRRPKPASPPAVSEEPAEE